MNQEGGNPTGGNTYTFKAANYSVVDDFKFRHNGMVVETFTKDSCAKLVRIEKKRVMWLLYKN